MIQELQRLRELYREEGLSEVYRGIYDYLLHEKGVPGHILFSTREIAVGETTVDLRTVDCETFARTTSSMWGEQNMLSAFEEEVGPDNVVWDIGSNVGVYSLIAAENGSETIAFEPQKEPRLELRRNAIENELDIVVEEIALSNEVGTAYLEDSGKTGGRGITDYETGERIALDTGDRICMFQNGVQPPDIVKIDVEGHEVEVLKGMSETLAEHVETVFIEVHAEVPNIDVLRVLWECGYTVTEEYENRRAEHMIRFDRTSLEERSTLVERK